MSHGSNLTNEWNLFHWIAATNPGGSVFLISSLSCEGGVPATILTLDTAVNESRKEVTDSVARLPAAETETMLFCSLP